MNFEKKEKKKKGNSQILKSQTSLKASAVMAPPAPPPKMTTVFRFKTLCFVQIGILLPALKSIMGFSVSKYLSIDVSRQKYSKTILKVQYLIVIEWVNSFS